MQAKKGVAQLDELARKYGLSTLSEDLAACSVDGFSVRPAKDSDIATNVNGYQLEGKDRLRLLSAGIAPKERQLAGDIRDPYAEIGQPGTPILGGMVQQEPSGKYQPFQVRGSGGFGSLYEKHYRQEPVIFAGINEGNNIFSAGRVVWHMPDVPLGQQSAVREFTKFIEQLWAQQWRGEQYLMRHLGAAKIFGFYPFEIVWSPTNRGRVGFTKFAPREPSTVDKWILDSRGNELQAVTFNPPAVSSEGSGFAGGGGGDSYTLTATGPSLTFRKVLIPNINARANNFEGISYIRPVLHWIKFKQVMAQMEAISAQKYGVPTPVIQAEQVSGVGLNAPNVHDLDAALDAVSAIQSADGAAIILPSGITAALLATSGQMPNFGALKEYADNMMEKVVAGEAAGLASNVVGSYAQASVQDNRLLRAQPGFAREVLQPFNWLVRDMAGFYGLELDAYPRAEWVMDGFDDASAWIADVTSAMGGTPMWQWPREIQEQALFKLDLSPTAFDDFDEPPIQPVQSFGADLKVRKLQAESGVLKTVDPRGLDPDKTSKELDAMAARVGRVVGPIITEMQSAWRDFVRDGVADPVQIEDQMRAVFRPQLEEAYLGESRKVSDQAKRMMLREYGLVVARNAPMPTGQRMEDALRLSAHSAASEAFNRQYGYMLDRSTGSAQSGDEDVGVPRLKNSTLAVIGLGIVHRAFAGGRDDLVETVKESAPELPPIEVRRSSMMDRNVCDECKKRDFENGGPVHHAGSGAYYDDMPPNHCEGDDRCRCVYIYSIPDGYQGALEDLAAGNFGLPEGPEGFGL